MKACAGFWNMPTIASWVILPRRGGPMDVCRQRRGLANLNGESLNGGSRDQRFCVGR